MRFHGSFNFRFALTTASTRPSQSLLGLLGSGKTEVCTFAATREGGAACTFTDDLLVTSKNLTCKVSSISTIGNEGNRLLKTA